MGTGEPDGSTWYSGLLDEVGVCFVVLSKYVSKILSHDALYVLRSSKEESESDEKTSSLSDAIPGTSDIDSCCWMSLDVDRHALRTSLECFFGSNGCFDGELSILWWWWSLRYVVETIVVEDGDISQPSESSRHGSASILSS